MQALSQLSYTPAAKEGRIIGIDFPAVKGFWRFSEMFFERHDNALAADHLDQRID